MCRETFRRNFRAKFTKLLDQLPLSDFQKETVKSRYVVEVCSLEDDYNRSVILFIGLTNLVTVAGILITSFTTLTKAITVDTYWQNVLSWTVWSLSLSLTLANGWLTTFGIYKKYVLNDVTLEKMYNEGWSFIAGVNRYEKLTTDERFTTFCSKIEQIITRTTIKQLADNTAGINVHDVLEVPPEPDSDKNDGANIADSSNPVDNTKPDNTNTANPRDVVITIDKSYQQDNIATNLAYKPRQKKKGRKKKVQTDFSE